MASRHLPAAERAAFVADLLREAPSLLVLDRRDRGDFLRTFYRRYEGAPVDRLRDDGWELFSHLLLAKSFPAGIARVRQHRALGHRTILITGALDLVVEPLRPLFDDIVCARLGEADGKFTGRLDVLPPIGEARALVLGDYAEAEGLQLEESMAYADSASDLPMLEAVGFPVAVNPEAKLAAIARRRGWHVEHWAKAEGGAQPLLPLGPLDRRGSLRRGRTSQAALAGAHAGGGRAGADEGARLRAEPAPFRRVPGGFGPRLGPGCRGRPLQLLDTEPPELPAGDWFHLRPPPVGDLRLGPGHPGRAQLALLRGHGQLPVRPRPRGGRRTRRRRDRPRRARAWSRAPGPSSSRSWGAPPATSVRSAPSARRATPACAATWPSVTSTPASRPGSAPTPAGVGPRRPGRPHLPAPCRAGVSPTRTA